MLRIKVDVLCGAVEGISFLCTADGLERIKSDPVLLNIFFAFFPKLVIRGEQIHRRHQRAVAFVQLFNRLLKAELMILVQKTVFHLKYSFKNH